MPTRPEKNDWVKENVSLNTPLEVIKFLRKLSFAKM